MVRIRRKATLRRISSIYEKRNSPNYAPIFEGVIRHKPLDKAPPHKQNNSLVQTIWVSLVSVSMPAMCNQNHVTRRAIGVQKILPISLQIYIIRNIFKNRRAKEKLSISVIIFWINGQDKTRQCRTKQIFNGRG